MLVNIRVLFTMESIYYVISWLCHRTCKHCYEDRFRPYYGDELRKVVSESEKTFPRIIEHLPDHFTYLDLEDLDENGNVYPCCIKTKAPISSVISRCPSA